MAIFNRFNSQQTKLTVHIVTGDTSQIYSVAGGQAGSRDRFYETPIRPKSLGTIFIFQR
jgi:hypothetical protein